ncbi:Oxidoreductase AflY [Apiospora phragmitis]|uniref:Oxidoreductase AflY n=1 Tax=Apiospora phragmitis TaxID=2905665 RepID=A0ABR1VXM5_9PEZI
MNSFPITLSPDHVGMVGVPNITPESLEECNRLLQKNHEEYHMFFRDTAGHNHIAHSLLTCLALGASPQELQDRYNDGTPIQRPMPEIDGDLLEKLSNPDVFYGALGKITQYHTFLEFFKREVAARGWRAVIQAYVFARTPVADAILARMYEGAYHPIIHLGLGVEFEQPSIVAEALAQAAAHDDSHIRTLFASAEAEAGIAQAQALIELVHEVRRSDAIRTAPRWSDFGNKMRDGVVGRAGEEMSTLAAQFRIRTNGSAEEGERELERRTAEMVNVAAFFAGAAQREGRRRKIDFFYMHAVTSSIFFMVLIRQDWIALADRARLVEWKARLDLAWYAVAGSAPLDEAAVSDYVGGPGSSDGMGWPELFRAVNQEHDDGHAAKFIRALKNGEDVCRKYEEDGEWAAYFLMKGDMWLRLARMCQDTTKDLPTDLKWVPFTGFEQPWKRPDLAN